MCTLTIDRRAGRLLLTMNRDERWTRAPERPPALHPATGGGRAWVAPADGERGGTWIGANDDGVVACLLNAYAPGDLDLIGRPDVPSRGEIIPGLLARGRDGVERFLDAELDPTRYPSFTLVVATPEGARALRWTLDRGLSHETIGEGWSLVSSSWWRAAEVTAWRRRRFDAWLAEGAPFVGTLPAFNLLEDPEAREQSPMMTRSFSGTRSVTRVEVDRERSLVGMRYWPRPGDGAIDPERPTAELELARRSE
ncbi:MAG TPA: NRDE family protein [Chondromyces sp.]|nr:NRDE family protein [Chondromyces sp.]